MNIYECQGPHADSIVATSLRVANQLRRLHDLKGPLRKRGPRERLQLTWR